MTYRFLLLALLTSGLCQAQGLKMKQTQPYTRLNLKKGQKFCNVYSRTISFYGDEIDPYVHRVSGSSNYEILDNYPHAPVMKGTDWYDGRPPHDYQITIRPDGTGLSGTTAFTNTGASGLLYNEVVWGKAPAVINAGDSWKVAISQPWELGGPGEQTVTVVSVDRQNQTVTLKREGYSEGYTDADLKQLDIVAKDKRQLKMDMQPGRSHWTGLTTFKNGIILNDELVVTRPVVLSSGNVRFTANERQYILLNAAPAEN